MDPSQYFRSFYHDPDDRFITYMRSEIKYEDLDSFPILVALIQRARMPLFYFIILKRNEINNAFVLDKRFYLNGDCTVNIYDHSIRLTLKRNLEYRNVLIDVNHSDSETEIFFLRLSPYEQIQANHFVETLRDALHRFYGDSCSDISQDLTMIENHFNQTSPQFTNVPAQFSNSTFYNSSDNSDDKQEMQQRSMMMLDERENEFVKWEKVRLFIGTWNVNGQLQNEPQKMRDYFLGCDPMPPDIYAIGFQELDVSVEAFMASEPIAKETHWVRLCERSLHAGANYQRVSCIRLVGMLLLVYVRKELCRFVTKVDSAYVGTGLLGRMGNKGGVATRFNFKNTTVCFVNCHLAAHLNQVERRNADYREILAKTKFPNSNCLIDSHDQIYWFGDMNYRINDMSSSQIKTALDNKDYASILARDQLSIEKAAKRVFHDFEEGPISFVPTYKYNPGTDEWDSSEKDRPPAWCDRILWKCNSLHSKNFKIIKLLIYRSHPNLKISDHKPVSALFDTSFKLVDIAKRKEIMDDIIKKLDKEENDYLPQVDIDKNEVDFGVVTFKDSPLANLVMKNVGKNPVQFVFKNKPEDNNFCKPWLQITPATSRIGLGETLIVTFELNFDVEPSVISKLNYGIEQLEDTLVLSLVGGRDVFITVSATYKPTSFGCSLDSLVKLNRPICEFTPADMLKLFGAEVAPLLGVTKLPTLSANQISKPSNLIDLGDSNSSKDQNEIHQIHLTPVYPIPKELFLMMDFVARKGFIVTNLFNQTGNEDSDFIRIREACDTSRPELLSQLSPNSVIEAIILFLHYLPDPVIPFDFFKRAITVVDDFNKLKQLINELPVNHSNTFQYLISFLKELLTHKMYNQLTAEHLVIKFAPAIVRPPLRANEQIRSNILTCSQKFLHVFLTQQPN